MIDEIKWFFEDLKYDKEKLYGFLGVITVIVVVVLGVKVVIDSENEGQPKGLIETVEYLETGSEELKETYSTLNKIETPTNKPEFPVHEVDLYVKKPYIDRGEILETLEEYVELQKVLDEEQGKQMRAMRFNLYDRKALHDERLEPNGVFEYRMSVQEIDRDKDLSVDSQGNAYEKDYEAAWRISTAETKKPKYDDYKLEGNYEELKKVDGIEPLSDQEFEWYLKLDKYNAITEGAGVPLYLMWELGADKKDSRKGYIISQFKEFEERLTKIGSRKEYYTYPDTIKQEMIITHPQLLHFAEFEEVAKDDYEARRTLLDSEPSLYTEPINEWLERISKERLEEVEEGTRDLDLENSGGLSDNIGEPVQEKYNELRKEETEKSTEDETQNNRQENNQESTKEENELNEYDVDVEIEGEEDYELNEYDVDIDELD